MRRSLQTTEESLGWVIKRRVPAIARAEWQANTVNNIDISRPVSELKVEYPSFEWNMMDPVFPAKEGLYAFSQESCTERGVLARKWLKDRKEKVVAVVSHDEFMRVVISQRMFGNADYRIFEFEEDGFGLVEWEWTEQSGGGFEGMPKGAFWVVA